MLSSTVVSDLLTSRFRPLERIVHNTSTDIVFSVRECFTEILNYVIWTRRLEGPSHDVEKALQTVIKEFRNKVDELMRPYRYSSRLMYNPNIIHRVLSMQDCRHKRNSEARVWAAGRNRTEANCKGGCVKSVTCDAWKNLHRQACELASDYTKAYYEDALQKLTSNFVLYAVEECLLLKLTTTFEAEQTSKAFERLINHEGDEAGIITCRSSHLQPEHGARLKTAIETLRRVQASQEAPSVAEFSHTTGGKSPHEAHISPGLTFSLGRYRHTGIRHSGRFGLRRSR
ncbi:hypothetical protein LY78DRAFT_721920 [Colletotrichum sublineola]|nr:hypothetical protein LY78DRAFT_721920 [Colletotrichum sublineola]